MRLKEDVGEGGGFAKTGAFHPKQLFPSFYTFPMLSKSFALTVTEEPPTAAAMIFSVDVADVKNVQ